MNVSKRTVLSIDDDHDLQLVIGHYLESEGYKVVTASDAATGKDKAANSGADVILLDLVLPDGEGLQLLGQIKGAQSDSAVIVVSGKTDTTEKIVCLEMGADDYMTKPFEMRELSARIKAVMRRRQAQMQGQSSTNNDNGQKQKDKEQIDIGNDWRLDRTQYQLFNKSGDSANLTTGEFKLLEALALSPNRALSREHLFDLTRDGEYDVYDRAIDIQIGRLRKKLHDEDANMLKTVRGVGYMLNVKQESA